MDFWPMRWNWIRCASPVLAFIQERLLWRQPLLLAKNGAHLVTLFALSNLWMARRALLAG